MPPFLDSLSSGQRTALLIGVPAVAALAIGTNLARRGDVDEEEAPPRAVMPRIPASTDVLGVGQLASFESHVTDTIRAQTTQLGAFAALLEEIGGTVDTLPGKVVAELPPSPPPVVVQKPAKAKPTPKPKPKKKKKPKGCSSPPAPTTLRAGEKVTSKVVTSDGCGALYLTQVGGVHTAGRLPSGAPVHLRGKGSIPGMGAPHTTPGNRPFIRIIWFGPTDKHGQRGYRIFNAKGQSWEFV